ncbi:family 2 encapsulin nanocompartment cargo protein terpene cyclase [Nocardia jejuensis]|uniref:family 2 encapsulin nanocompartment cargo protein terpene cyclase n=1 Tax=Nocardia jejuensis TaxID=328049 RepID=UPI000A54625D|nr:family 2 encapsulin nanocompartment cargo protein terpene cyclase [Nocardia jejuensis]
MSAAPQGHGPHPRSDTATAHEVNPGPPSLGGGPTGLGTALARRFGTTSGSETAQPDLAPVATPVHTATSHSCSAGSSSMRLGESAFRLPARRLTADLEPCRLVAWGDGSAPPVYLPPAPRNDDRLAAEVDDRLAAWGSSLGFTDDELGTLRKTGYGRLVMLTHTDCEDPDLLLVAAQMNTAWWMADDYFADDSELGADPVKLPQRLTMVMAAMDPLPSAGEFSAPLNAQLRSDKVLRTFTSAISHLRAHSTPGQLHRACYATFSMFVSWTAYAAWRHSEISPAAWEYLAARQHDSFYTSMTLIDVLAAYEVPANLYYDDRVRTAAFRAGTTSVLINDLLSVKKDAADPNPVCNMVLQIAADRGCSVARATEITVDLHNRMVRDFEADLVALRAVPSPELQMFLRGLRSWIGGGFEWHNTNPRYR